MGSGASVSEEPRLDTLEAREAEPGDTWASTPAEGSNDTLQADLKEGKAESHTVDAQSVKSDGGTSKEMEEEEAAQPVVDPAVTETAAEGEEVSLHFESFLHENGMLYSCFSHHGNRVYMDASQKLQPFPKEWYNQGHFIATRRLWSAADSRQQPVDGLGGRPHRQHLHPGQRNRHDLQERVNVCRFWDPESGLWLLLLLQWEMNTEFVKARVQRVTSALPGLVDQKEITAALRQCNYDPDEVISVYHTMFGDILLQAPPGGNHNYPDLNSFRALLERDRVIEDLKQKLQMKEKEVDNLFQRNSHLVREVRYLTDVVQHLNQKLAELEADKQELREKIRSLLNRRASPAPPAKPVIKPAVDIGQLHQMSRLTRELNVSNKHLRSVVHQALADIKNHLGQFEGPLGKLAQVEQEATSEVEKL
ncbi:uncharacterized protein LOC112847430 [Oreochromis niloticus]|uniref:uncharacterized protein LOC112847430 n=1 Tax=Oreochromis niloticus TaxID=8128 RepID=UPI000DF2AF75|nr:uncharacterized protein LOC112847430 [Oreochromis niloticus]